MVSIVMPSWLAQLSDDNALHVESQVMLVCVCVCVDSQVDTLQADY